MLHIFLLFECIPAPVKYYGSCFSSPESSNAIGILGILGILVTPQPALAGLLALTSSTALSNATSQSQKLQPIPPHANAHGLGFGLADLFHRTNPTQRAVKPKTPALPTNRTSPASGLTSALLRRTEPGLKLRTIPPAPRFGADLCPSFVGTEPAPKLRTTHPTNRF